MPEQQVDPVLTTFALGMMVLSVTACMQLLVMYRKGAILRFEPRRPVPWGAVGGLLAAVLLLSIAYSAVAGGSAPPSDVAPEVPSASRLVVPMVAQSLIVVVFLFVVALFSRAKLSDLGLPTNVRVSARDAAIGAAACLAALAPVRIVQILLTYMFFPELIKTQGQSEHPVVKMMLADHDVTFFLLTGLFTVVAAPICEEITFRLLLQGWLERWEDDRLGWRTPRVEETAVGDGIETDGEASVGPEMVLPPEPTEPPRRGVYGLPYGWFPILVSAAAFGLAHYGYGPEPVPIFILGIVLGYVYQRTHRILPSIVTHALFNLFNMIILWRMIYYHG